jgi:Ca2+-binding RTX toxin-like protein
LQDWDFVSTATVFTFFDRGRPGYIDQFGLARNRLRKDGTPDWTTSGQVLKAAANRSNFSAWYFGRKSIGVDLHLTTDVSSLKRNPQAHETLLLGDGIDELDCGAGDDIVFGGGGGDTLSGGEGYDKLYGGAGNDVLSGDAGDDRLKGGAGDDHLKGGTGRDNFVFTSFSSVGNGSPGHDIVEDFDVTSDRITLVGLAGEKADIPQRLTESSDGVLFTWDNYGSTILLKGVRKKHLSGRHFHVLR